LSGFFLYFCNNNFLKYIKTENISLPKFRTLAKITKIKYRKMKKLFFTVCISAMAFAQNPSGYWDKERAMTKDFKVAAGERTYIKSEDLPTGTTEVVYRITLLDDNQQLSQSLVSMLKAVPDPSGVSKGAAGAVTLMSMVSGEDKCKYAIFTTEDLVKNYQKVAKTDKACWVQTEPVNKDAKVLSFSNSSCLKDNTLNLFFGFESDNWFMDARIVLEIVPWVDYNASRGWNANNRKTILNQCKTSETAKALPDSDAYCVCMVKKFQETYKFHEYKSLLPSELKIAFDTAGNDCLAQTGDQNKANSIIRKNALALATAGKIDEGIELLQTKIIQKKRGTALDYNTLGFCYLLAKQYDKANKALTDAENLDASEIEIQLTKAHYYVLTDDLSKAKDIHKKYKNQNISPKESWATRTQKDLEIFKKAGFSTDDFEKILRVLE